MKKKIEISEEDKKKLENEFEALAKKTEERINEKLAIASDALREAIAISKETGIPFSSGISFLRNTYHPESFDDLYGNLDSDFVEEITGTWRDEYGGAGWRHSAVC